MCELVRAYGVKLKDEAVNENAAVKQYPMCPRSELSCKKGHMVIDVPTNTLVLARCARLREAVNYAPGVPCKDPSDLKSHEYEEYLQWYRDEGREDVPETPDFSVSKKKVSKTR